MKPGARVRPVASITASALVAASMPTKVIRPSAMATSASKGAPPLPSSTRAPRMSVSQLCIAAKLSGGAISRQLDRSPITTRPMPIDSDDSVPLVVSAMNKGIGPIASPLEPEETIDVGWSLLDEEIALPTAVLYEEKLAHNVKWMRAFMKEYGVQLAPHGKTTMAPKLLARQTESGAWGLTV